MIDFGGFVQTEGQPIYLQIMRYIKQGLAAGTITDGEEMPSRRALSALLTVNPNTIQKAYQELESEGVIYTVGGKGCFVGGEENAAEATCRRAEAELREALRQARLAGVEKTTAEALVERCYGGNE